MNLTIWHVIAFGAIIVGTPMFIGIIWEALERRRERKRKNG